MAGKSEVLRALFASWGREPAIAAIFRVHDEAKPRGGTPVDGRDKDGGERDAHR
jgi:hypothetical protein